MGTSVSELCWTCIITLTDIISILSDPNRKKGQVHDEQVNDELERFRLWMGNIGALNQPDSSMSLESRLHKTKDVLDYVLQLLNDLNMFAKECGSTVSSMVVNQQRLAIEEDSDPENDARSYTTVSRSADGDLDLSTTVRIPKLNELQKGSKKEVECPFCFRIKRFKNEQMWRRHVFSDLRPYVCTFPDCDVPYFSDINEWFRHEMQSHRVSYTCRLCKCKAFQLRERYLTHVRKQHPDMIEDGEEQPILNIARKPLDQIPAQECPCCSDWVDRLKERAGVSVHSDASDHIISVVPTVFKRHLASHLEQLALFAVPIGSIVKSVIDSNAAVEEDVGTVTGGPDLSILAFNSSRPSSPASKEQSYDDFPYTEEVDKAAAAKLQGGEYSKELYTASASGHEQVVKLLLDKGADVNAQGGHYGNALHAALAEGHEQVVKLLLNQGADINAQGGHYGNALQAASTLGNEQVVKLLLDKGADVNAQGGHYGNALLAASAKGREQVVKLLLNEGADINAQGGYYGNALQAASASGNEQVVKLLIDKGANVVNAQGGTYGNALQAASAKGHEQVVKLLLNQGADVNAQGGAYGNALQAASAEGYAQVVKLLFDKGANVNAQGGHYGNALHAASAKGHEQVVKLLLETDQVDVSLENKDGQTPLLLAIQNGHEVIVELLQSHSNVS